MVNGTGQTVAAGGSPVDYPPVPFHCPTFDGTHPYTDDAERTNRCRRYAAEESPEHKVSRFPTNHLGTIRDISHYGQTAGTTEITNHITYDSFGNVTSETNLSDPQADPTDHLFAFTGRPFDEAIGLQNSLNRWYDGAIGQWLSEDPIGFEAGDANQRRYVRNGPLSSTDPTGLSALGKVLREAITEASEAAIKRKVKQEIRDNWYQYITKYISKEGLSELYQVHHIIVQRLFKDPEFGRCFHDIGILQDASRNTKILPTKYAAKRGMRIGDAALHQGRHIKDYDKLVEEPLQRLMERYNTNAISKTDAYEEVVTLQTRLRVGLRDGSIKLQHYDTPANRREWLQNGTTAIMALAIFSGMSEAEAQEVALEHVGRLVENETYYRQKNVIVRYGTAGYYVRDSNSSLALWVAFAAEFFNPVEDVIFVTDVVEDAARLGINKLVAAEDTARELAESMARSMRNMNDRNSAIRSRKRLLEQYRPSTRPSEPSPPPQQSSPWWWWPF